jgi:hypothetical protein
MTRAGSHHKNVLHSSLATLTLVALAHPAAADDATIGDPASAPASAVDPAAPTNVAAVAPDANTGTTITTGATLEAPASRYPRTVFARPLTLPANVAMLGADASGNHDFSAMGGAPIVGYGITDKLEVQVPYGFAAHEFEAKGSVDVDVGYAILRGALGGKLEAIARVRAGYNLLDEAARPLQLGLHVQYSLTDRIALISGTPGTQQLRISLSDDATMRKPVDLGIPFGVGFQVTNLLYTQLDTKLAQINLGDSVNAVIIRDATPVTLTVVYNVLHALDVQAAIGTDLSNSPGDTLTFLVGARFYAGRL